MTDTSTAPDNKPSNLRHILYLFEQKCHKARIECLSEKQLTRMLLHEQAGAIAAIETLLPDTITDELIKFAENEGQHSKAAYYRGSKDAIDTTLRNFSGQTEGEGEEGL